MVKTVPLPTLKRFPSYLSIVEGALKDQWISTSFLSEKTGNPAITIRKDIGYLGLTGMPKKGFNAKDLYKALTEALGGESSRDLIIIGTYGLGGFYLETPQEIDGGYKIRAGFDFIEDEDLSARVPIYPFSRLEDLIPRLGVTIALVSFKENPEEILKLGEWGIKGILNLGPQEINIGIPEVKLSPLEKLSELKGIVLSNK